MVAPRSLRLIHTHAKYNNIHKINIFVGAWTVSTLRQMWTCVELLQYSRAINFAGYIGHCIRPPYRCINGFVVFPLMGHVTLTIFLVRLTLGMVLRSIANIDYGFMRKLLVGHSSIQRATHHCALVHSCVNLVCTCID